MNIAFRAATPQDLDYCAGLYFAGMDTVIRALNLDMAVQAAGFRRRWLPGEVRIITRAGADIGWLQAAPEGDALFLKQLFVDAPRRNQGIGAPR